MCPRNSSPELSQSHNSTTWPSAQHETDQTCPECRRLGVGVSVGAWIGREQHSTIPFWRQGISFDAGFVLLSVELEHHEGIAVAPAVALRQQHQNKCNATCVHCLPRVDTPQCAGI
eukprot:1829180-Rhodomonas_salina.1